MVPSQPDSGTLDWTPKRMLARLDGDTELALQLCAIFVDECPRMLQRLRDALASGSPDDVRRAAHALKGSVSNFIDGGPTATAFELENIGRGGQLEGAALVLERLERELAVLTACLQEFQSKGAGSSD
jgi:two-component system, sensor histidine kinase and response regulator